MKQQFIKDQAPLFTTVQRHVENAIVPTTNKDCRCIDGRYGEDPAYIGSMARPGAHFGYVMTLLAVSAEQKLGLSPEECFERVYTAVTNLGHRFSMHTDHTTHPPHEGGCTCSGPYVPIGCGHITKALDPACATAYKVPNANIEAALAYAPKKNGGIAMANLAGSHEEDALLVVMGTERTVLPFLDDHSFFVYDAWRDHVFMERLVVELAIPGVDAITFFRAADVQLNATLRLVAPNTPIFNVDLSGNRPVIAPAGIMR